MYKDYYWLNQNSREFLSRGYIAEGVEPEKRYREIAEAAERILGIDGFADRFEANLKRGWYSLASPIISNFGIERGLPISCNGSYVDDNLESIMYKAAEIGIMSKHGAGTSAYLGALRHRGASIGNDGGTSTGPVHFAEIFDTITNVVSQSNVRRGSCAVYMDTDHPDIEEFLTIRDEKSNIQDLTFGVCIPDSFYEKLKKKDPKSLRIWGNIIKKRFKSGFPYIFNTDNVNNNKPDCYEDDTIYASNLCTEIMLPSNPIESFVCDLSSMNLVHYEEWRHTDAVELLVYFLDAVMTEYIEKTDGIKFMEHARNFAIRHRALGVGGLGWHSYLQSKMIPFESMEAKYKNVEIWKFIKEKAYKASKELAVMFGEPEKLKGFGRRNTTLLAIAPTVSSSFILGQVSPGIEPEKSNYYKKDLAKGGWSRKNPYLKTVLEFYGKNTKETWNSIEDAYGSVQHLDFLSPVEKDVFKTFAEISQKEVVIQAAQRQKYIDQAQSLNLEIHPDTNPKDVSDLLIFGWEQGIKTFYYQKGENAAKMLVRDINKCLGCDG